MDLMSNCSSIKCKDGTFYYNKLRHFDGRDVYFVAAICGYVGNTSVLEIPEIISDGENLPVKIIEKKAFLGNEILKEVYVPESVEEVRDWAFSQCLTLRKVAFLNEDVKLGKGVFEDSLLINDICIGYRDNDKKSALIGTVPCLLKAEYLLSGSEIGDESWYGKWDSKLLDFLVEDNEEGYTNIVLCGEEDIQRSIEGFVSDKIKLKSKLCLLRLMNDDYLASERRRIFTDYVRDYASGKASDESWQVILEDFGDNLSVFKFFIELGNACEENIDTMIADLGIRHPETKAYLMSYKQENFAAKDIFASFVL